jgi:hypothetical protein
LYIHICHVLASLSWKTFDLRFLSNVRTTLKRTCEIVFLFRPICYPTFFLIWLSKASSSQLRSRSTQWPNLIIPIFSVYLEKEEWITFHRCSTSISNGMYYVSSMMYHDIKWNELRFIDVLPRYQMEWITFHRCFTSISNGMYYVSLLLYLDIKWNEWKVSSLIYHDIKWNEWIVSTMFYLDIKLNEWCCIFIELKWNELHSNKL